MAVLRRPNVLLVTTDAQRADTVAAWQRATGRAPTAHSPNADALADAGVLFTDAHTSSPVCSPARASLLLGVTPFVHGTLENDIFGQLPNVSDAWPKLLKRRGYATALFGKMDFGPQPESWFDVVSLSEGNLQKKMRGPGHNTSNFLESVLVSRTISFIKSVRPGTPFAVHTSFISPHHPYDWPDGPWGRAYDEGDEALPQLNGQSATGEQLPALEQWLNGNMPQVVSTKAKRDYYVLAAYVDAQLGRLLEHLRSRKQLWQSTLVIYTSDHGCMLGEHGIDAKHSFHDSALRVPLVLSLPGVLPAGAVRGFASTIDIPATIVATASLFDPTSRYPKPPPEYSGYDLVGPIARGGPSPRAVATAALYTAFTVVTHRWKLAYYPEQGEGRLWDRLADPGEHVDLYGANHVREIKTDLLRAAFRWRAMQLPLRFLQRSATPRPPVGSRVAKHTVLLSMARVEDTLQVDALAAMGEVNYSQTVATRLLPTEKLQLVTDEVTVTKAVLVIGEQKSGTTMLYDLVRKLLANETLPGKKELHIFDRALGCAIAATAKTCTALMAEQATPSGLYVDATPSYFASASAFDQLAASLPPRRRLLLIIRNDPIARARSGWENNVAASALIEPRTFETAVQEELVTLYERCFGAAEIGRFPSRMPAAAAEEMVRRVASTVNPWEALPLGWSTNMRSELPGGKELSMELPLKPGLHNGTCKPSLQYCWQRPLSSSERDCKRYLIRGLQASKLREWQRRYDSSELLVLRMEDVITQDMAITSQRLARFIGVPDPAPATVADQREAQTREHWHGAHGGNATNAVLSVSTTAVLRAFYEEDQRQLALMTY